MNCQSELEENAFMKQQQKGNELEVVFELCVLVLRHCQTFQTYVKFLAFTARCGTKETFIISQ